MPVGLQLFDASGATVFDSTQAIAGVPVGVYQLNGGASGFTVDYTAMAGRTLEIVPLDIFSNFIGGVSLSYPGGIPRLTVSTQASARSFMVICL